MDNLVNEEFVFDKLTNKPAVDGREKLSFETVKPPASLNFGKLGDITGDKPSKGPNVVRNKSD